MSPSNILVPLFTLSLFAQLGPAIAFAEPGAREQQEPEQDREQGQDPAMEREREGAGRFEITPFVGPRTHGAFRTGEENDNLIVEVEDSASYGLFVNYGLTDYLKAEALFTRQSSTVVQGDAPTGTEAPAPPVPPGEALFDVTIDYLHGGLLYDGGNDTFSGYAGASIGLARLAPDFPDAATRNKFSFSLGIGFKTFFTEQVGFRFDARAFGLRAGENQEVIASGGVFDPVTFKRASTFWQTHFVVGVVIRL